jgi:hypothetical protein
MSSPSEVGNCREPVRRSSEAVYSDRPKPLMAPAIDMEAPLPNPPLAPLPQYQAF